MELLSELMLDPSISRADKLALFDRQIEIDREKRETFIACETRIRELTSVFVDQLPTASRVLVSVERLHELLLLLWKQELTSPIRPSLSVVTASLLAISVRCWTTGRIVPISFDAGLSGDSFRIEPLAA